jgi:hypothetical protein
MLYKKNTNIRKRLSKSKEGLIVFQKRKSMKGEMNPNKSSSSSEECKGRKGN